MAAVAEVQAWLATPAGGRLGVFLGAFCALALMEAAWTARPHQRRGRWGPNLGLGVAGALVGRLVPGAGALAVAAWAQETGFGLAPALGLDGLWAVVFVVVAMDCVIYWQHRAFHRTPWLWRLHKVHHADDALDLTTALRFHPIEILISLGVKAAAAAALGASPAAVLIFEALLNASAMFNHANLRLARPLDGLVRLGFVTPAMHRVHHSADGEEMNRNYGFCLSVWDRLFASYRAQPLVATIGLPETPARSGRGFARALAMPFLPPRS